MSIGFAIKTIRKHRGLYQWQLAYEIGISQNALCLIEKNNTKPQKKTIQAICHALNVPESYLLFLSINEDDVPERIRLPFSYLNNALRAIILDDIKSNK